MKKARYIFDPMNGGLIRIQRQYKRYCELRYYLLVRSEADCVLLLHFKEVIQKADQRERRRCKQRG